MRPLFAALLAVSLSPALAQTPPAPIQVRDAWARATAPHAESGGIFLTLTDPGPADHLLGASTPVAATAELHETTDDHGIMRMRPVPALPLPPNTPVTLKPGGLHIMLLGLKHPLARGQTFPVTLTFEHAAPVTATVTVGTAGAAGP